MPAPAKPLSFYQRVYGVVAQIPYGKVATYGQIALILGSPRASRVVGGALAQNKLGGELPCHRVLNRHGALAPPDVFGAGLQRQMLEGEGIVVSPQGLVDLKRFQWQGYPEGLSH